jgi:hypothetical protein
MPCRYSASAFQFPSPYISPEPPPAVEGFFVEGFFIEGFFVAREAVFPEERFAGLFGEVFDRALDAFGRALDFLRGFAALRDDGREDFEEVVFFFAAPRAAADFRPVFFARLELFDLPAALPAAFFFFFFAT